MKYIFLCGLFLGFLATHTEAKRILGLFAYPSQSHFNAIQPLMTALAKKNYNVTVVSSFRLGEKVENYKEVIVPAFDFWTDVKNELGVKNMFEAAFTSSERAMRKGLVMAGIKMTDSFLQHTKFAEVLRSAEQDPFDLIIVDLFHTEGLLMVGEALNTTTIGIASSNFEDYITTLVDYNVPSACSPIDFQSPNDNASFFERISKFFNCIKRRIYRKRELFAQQMMTKRYFPGTRRSLTEVQTEMPLVLVNNYAPLLTTRPTLAKFVPVGGMHIKPTQSIQWNIKNFLDDARDGAIYLSLGSVLKCSDLPKSKLNALVTVLGKQKQKVLWHCDVEKMENLPKNILLQKIISSSDVLAHPHIKYFITSGGLAGLQEAIHRNIPILGIPVFRDQRHNIRIVENLGIGINLEFLNLTETSLSWALETLGSAQSYLTNVREVSAIYRDRPLGSIPTSLFWVEHVLRHKNMAHWKVAGTNILWNQLYLFDVIIVIVLIILFILIVCYALLRLYKFVLNKRKQQKLFNKLR